MANSVLLYDAYGNPINSTSGALNTTDAADGPVSPGAAADKSVLVGLQYNSTLPAPSNTQQVAFQCDSKGRLITSPPAYTYFHPIFTTRLQEVANINSTNTTTLTTNISTTLAGDLIVVVATSASGTLTCTDSASQSYSTAVTINSGGGNPHYEYVFYKANTAAGVTSVTISDGTATSLNMIVSEYSDISSTPLDQTASQSNTALTWSSSATPTTTQAQELLIGAAFDISHNTSTFSPGTNWTTVLSAANGAGPGGVVYQEEQFISSTGDYAATGSISSADTVLAAIATFKLSTLPSNFVFINQSTTIKASPGTLSQININSLGVSGSTVTFYDGSVSASTKLSTVSLSTQIGAIPFNLSFLTSLIMVVNSNTADFTVLYN